MASSSRSVRFPEGHLQISVRPKFEQIGSRVRKCQRCEILMTWQSNAENAGVLYSSHPPSSVKRLTDSFSGYWTPKS
jgi:hypothetical protein